MKYLNIGCGFNFHTDWENIDVNPLSTSVKAHDIRIGLPYSNDTFNAVYSSHVLEHLSQTEVKKLLIEIKRVLKINGIIRVVVPDLESIIKLYLEKLEASINNIAGAEDDYNWITLELLDQLVRCKSGGDMLGFLLKKELKNKNFIQSRIGLEAEKIWRQEAQKSRVKLDAGKCIRFIRDKISKTIVKWISGEAAFHAFEEGLFRNSGEIHRWMYDRFSLKRLLESSGFKKVRVCNANESRILNFNTYTLDVFKNKISKPDSLFMEGEKNEKENFSQTR